MKLGQNGLVAVVSAVAVLATAALSLGQNAAV